MESIIKALVVAGVSYALFDMMGVIDAWQQYLGKRVSFIKHPVEKDLDKKKEKLNIDEID